MGLTPLPSPRFLPLSGKIVKVPLPGGQSTRRIASRQLLWSLRHAADREYGPRQASTTFSTILMLGLSDRESFLSSAEVGIGFTFE